MSLPRSVQRLRDYIATPSVNPMGRTDIDPTWLGETRYAELVRDQLAKLHVDAVLVGRGQRQSVVARIEATDPIDTVLIASHLDTVPVDGMTIAPFDPVVEGGRILGRGSCDTKAGMAALMAALETTLADGTLRRNIVLVGEADEEMASRGVEDVLAHLPARPADWALVTEPTELRLVHRHKGRATVEIVADGRACHASDPDQGQNAIVSLAHATIALTALHDRLRVARDPELGAATLAVSVIAGGQAPNIVPDRGYLVLDRRMLPSETLEAVRAEIEACLLQAGVSQHARVRTCSLDKAALETPLSHAAVYAAQAALEAASLSPAPTVAAFGTDAGPLAAAGVPGIVIGPGSIAQAHTADEYVPQAEVEAMTDFFVALLRGDMTPKGTRA